MKKRTYVINKDMDWLQINLPNIVLPERENIDIFKERKIPVHKSE